LKRTTYRIDVKLVRVDGSKIVDNLEVYGAALCGDYLWTDPTNNLEIEMSDDTFHNHSFWTRNCVPASLSKLNNTLRFQVIRKPTKKDLKFLISRVDAANQAIQKELDANIVHTLALVSDIVVTRVTETVSYERIKIPNVLD
jgi:hypothetical protein